MPYRFNRSHQLLVRNRLCALFDSIVLQALHKEPAMNGTSGFVEVRSAISRSSKNRLRREQRPQFETGSWHFLRTYDLIAHSTVISKIREKIPGAIFMQVALMISVLLFVVPPIQLSHALDQCTASQGLLDIPLLLQAESLGEH